jgi:rhombotail lipoprotein
LMTLSLSGCSLLFDWGIDHGSREQYRSTELVEFLYGNERAPHDDAKTQLQLPLRIGLSFLPSMRPRAGDIPTAADKAQVLEAIRQRFSALPYVTEIVVIPDYYLSARPGDGFQQAQQLARMFRLDLYALASFDQVVYAGENGLSLGYITILGSYLLKGELHEAHTVVDLAVIEPTSRSLVMRAGGTAKFADSSTLAEDWRGEMQVRRKSFEQASTALIDNFAQELKSFEERVRSGTAPVTVARRNGGAGALDATGICLLLACLSTTVLLRLRASPRRRHALPGGVTAIRVSRGT